MWLKLATNPECVSALLDGLAFCRDGMTTCLHVLLEKAQQTEACLLEKTISTLLHTLAQVHVFAGRDERYHKCTFAHFCLFEQVYFTVR